MAIVANIDQPILNHIIVGSVFTVELQTRERLDTKANIKSHHICTPKIKPGKIIKSFTKKAKNSTVFALFQYSFLFMVFNATIHGILEIIQ